MRIGVMGAGAVGGYFGARLAAAGHRVALIARGTHLAALRRQGLRVDSPGGSLRLETALYSSDPADVGIVDMVLFCVKSYDTETAADLIQPMMGPETFIVSLQNGVDNADRIARRWIDHGVYAGVVYAGLQVAAPGAIEHSSGGRIVLGRCRGGSDEALRNIARVFEAAAVPCEASGDIRRAQWRKLLWNAPFCAISCLTRATAREIVVEESLRELAVDCMKEVIAAAGTRGVDLEIGLIDETLEFSRSLGDFKPSMLQDLEADKPLEYDAFNGVVVRLLRQSGHEAAVNHVFYGALSYLDKKIRQAVAT